jgi:drug/metabolite transporter (DMT)-like permease
MATNNPIRSPFAGGDTGGWLILALIVVMAVGGGFYMWNATQKKVAAITVQEISLGT